MFHVYCYSVIQVTTISFTTDFLQGTNTLKTCWEKNVKFFSFCKHFKYKLTTFVLSEAMF